VKFACERDELLSALTTAGRAVSPRGNASPVLAGLRLRLEGDRLEVTGSDMDLTISTTIPVGAAQPGTAVLPAKLVADVVRALPKGRVELQVDDDSAHIAAGRTEFSLRVYPPDEYPRIEPVEGEEVTIDASVVAAALGQVVRAASADDSRPILTGVLLAAETDGLRLVATDSYRLAMRDMPGTTVLAEGQSVLVPSRSLVETNRLLGDSGSLTIRLGRRDASFEIGSTVVTTRLIEGEFPNYRGLIPDSHPNRLRVSRDALLEAVRRVRLLAQEATPIRLAMSADGLELIAITLDVGQAHESVEATYDGEPLTVAFNPEYLVDGIEVSPGDELVLETLDAVRPAVIRGDAESNFTYLLMPVRVS
jgi:DNA polymerase III subunit beta